MAVGFLQRFAADFFAAEIFLQGGRCAFFFRKIGKRFRNILLGYPLLSKLQSDKACAFFCRVGFGILFGVFGIV